jgi:serine/threonine protein kinase
MSLQTHDDFDAANREIQNIIRIPRSAAVVQYYGWFQVGKWAIVGMELCSGDLSDFKGSSMYGDATAQKKTKYNWEILKETADGLAACHSRGLIHRDLKPTNSRNSRFATDHNSSLPKF